jgi:hypothetical protein
MAIEEHRGSIEVCQTLIVVQGSAAEANKDVVKESQAGSTTDKDVDALNTTGKSSGPINMQFH